MKYAFGLLPASGHATPDIFGIFKEICGEASGLGGLGWGQDTLRAVIAPAECGGGVGFI